MKVLVNRAIPFGEMKPDGMIDVKECDLVRSVIDIPAGMVESLTPHPDPSITVINYWGGQRVYVYHTFEEMYDVIRSIESVDERFKETVEIYKKDNFALFKQFRDSNRETD